MATQHPLTDKICDSIAPCPVQHPDVYECMRTAAEWQLIQVIQFISKEDTFYADYIYKAMRSQQQLVHDPYVACSSLEWKLGIHLSEWRASRDLDKRTGKDPCAEANHLRGIKDLLNDFLAVNFN